MLNSLKKICQWTVIACFALGTLQATEEKKTESKETKVTCIDQ